MFILAALICTPLKSHSMPEEISSQPKQGGTDIVLLDSIRRFSNEISELNFSRDSIQSELEALSNKSDFYNTDLENIVTAFSVIVGGLLAFAFAVSYMKLQSERKEIETETKMQIGNLTKQLTGLVSDLRTEFNTLSESHENTAVNLATTAGNSYMSIAHAFFKENKYRAALRHFINALGSRVSLWNMLSKEEKSKALVTIKLSLKWAIESIDKIIAAPNNIEDDDEKKEILEIIDDAFQITDEEFKNSLAEIRVKVVKIYR